MRELDDELHVVGPSGIGANDLSSGDSGGSLRLGCKEMYKQLVCNPLLLANSNLSSP